MRFFPDGLGIRIERNHRSTVTIPVPYDIRTGETIEGVHVTDISTDAWSSDWTVEMESPQRLDTHPRLTITYQGPVTVTTDKEGE